MRSGVNFPSGVGIVHNLSWPTFSGAPPSSTFTCAVAAQITASQDFTVACRAITFAPVPLKTGNTRASLPKC